MIDGALKSWNPFHWNWWYKPLNTNHRAACWEGAQLQSLLSTYPSPSVSVTAVFIHGRLDTTFMSLCVRTYVIAYMYDISCRFMYSTLNAYMVTFSSFIYVERTHTDTHAAGMVVVADSVISVLIDRSMYIFIFSVTHFNRGLSVQSGFKRGHVHIV